MRKLAHSGGRRSLRAGSILATLSRGAGDDASPLNGPVACQAGQLRRPLGALSLPCLDSCEERGEFPAASDGGCQAGELGIQRGQVVAKRGLAPASPPLAFSTSSVQ
jgi:hypothetical protein